MKFFLDANIKITDILTDWNLYSLFKLLKLNVFVVTKKIKQYMIVSNHCFPNHQCETMLVWRLAFQVFITV